MSYSLKNSRSMPKFEKQCVCYGNDSANLNFYTRSFIRPTVVGKTQFFEKKNGETFIRESRLNHKSWMPRQTSNVDFFDPLHKATLRFLCYLNESDGEDGELLKVRPMRLAFHLDDGTFSMSEPYISNSGYIQLQGRVFYHQKVPRGKGRETIGPDMLGWRDITVGKDVTMFGRTYHIVSCDPFTKSFYEDRGVNMPDTDDTLPIDAWTMTRHFGSSSHSGPGDASANAKILHSMLHENEAALSFKSVVKIMCKTIKSNADLRSWESLPSQLIFHVAWLDSANDFHNAHVKRTFKMVASTDDDTVTLTETTPGFNNALFLRSSRLPFVSQSGVVRYYQARLMRPGSWIEVFRRPMFIYGCEGDATERFLSQQYGETRFAECTIEILKRGPPPQQFHIRPAQLVFYAQNTEFPKMDFILFYMYDAQRIDIFEASRLRQWTKARPFLLDIDASHIDAKCLRPGSEISLFRWKFMLVKAHPATETYLQSKDFQPSAAPSPRLVINSTPPSAQTTGDGELARRIVAQF